MTPSDQEQCSRLVAALSAAGHTESMTSTTTAPRTARAVARAELTEAILRAATAQLGEVGPAALSLRAVARDLGMASSALYRYFPSRDALLTALIIRCYDDLGGAVEIADAGVGRADHAGRFAALAHALHDWARAHPHEYALLYGSPVPGYAAPADTVGAAGRVTAAVLSVVRDAQVAGRRPTHRGQVPEPEAASVAPVASATSPPLVPAYAVRGLLVWSTLVGHVSLELFGHLHRGVLDYDVHFAHVVGQLVADLGLLDASS